MKEAKLLAIFILGAVNLFSQGINNLWLMGYDNPLDTPHGGIIMDFAGGNLNISYENRKLNFSETNGIISNSNGNLLFASNGIFIQNAANDTMVNGSDLNPAYFTTSKKDYGLTIPQANLVIPFPDNSLKYYLFHETSDDYGFTYSPFYLYYSVIDMSQDSGRGAVILKNEILLNDILIAGRLTACKHANGRDWWLISHQYNSNLYYKYLVTPFGIDGPSLQNIGHVRGNNFGQCLFSPDGSLFAYYEPVQGDLDIFDFDRCTGDFTMKAQLGINDSAIGGGAAFSSNSKVLYLSSMNYVYQLDLTSSNIPSTKTTVATYDGYYSPQPPLATIFYLAQLAPDGKIYINCSNSTRDIHVINNPDSLGLACDVCQHCIHLPAYNAFTIPNYPNYFLGAESGSVCDTLTSISTISSNENKLNVFPNPVYGEEATFTYSVNDSPSELIINNIEGKEVDRFVLPQWSSIQKIKLPELSPGIYIARIVSKHLNSNVKFVVE